MENVKGMLSSSLNETRIFERVLADLRNAGGGYRLVALSPRYGEEPNLFAGSIDPRNFIIRAEDFGLPQARHRVIVVGIRHDLLSGIDSTNLGQLMTPWSRKSNVEDVLDGMPKLRSGLSRNDSPAVWKQTMKDAAAAVCKAVAFWPAPERSLFRARVNECAQHPENPSRTWPRSASRPAKVGAKCADNLASWLLDPRLGVLPNNETRSHMPSDFSRYLFASVYAELLGVSPKACDFPEALTPDHRSWDSGSFADRFRVQLKGQPSTTITSHISKDGHYFIHPDPEQCRSLTAREAARLQTFPDNYFFKGNRTQQFIQIGNAVPPFLAKQIASGLYTLVKRCLEGKDGTQARGTFTAGRATSSEHREAVGVE